MRIGLLAGLNTWTLRPARFAALACALLLALPGVAAAATRSWTGAGSSGDWSDSANWDTAPVNGDSLVFPSLASSLCGGSTAGPSCYQTVDDESLSVAGIMIDDGAGYEMQWSPPAALTVGAGGLNATTTDTTGAANPVFDVPIQLGTSQQWSIDGGPAGDGVTAAGNIAGFGHTLTVNLSNGGYLFSQTQLITSGFTAQGTVDTDTGADAGLNGEIDVGAISAGADSLNASGSPVAITNAELAVLGSTNSGALTVSGGQLFVGSGYCCSAYATLNVAGDVSLDSNSDTTMLVGPGQTAGDYAQISASGNVTLNGTLELENLGPHGCVGLTPGDVDTLISTTGTLNGTFSNAADGSTVSFQCGPPGTHAAGMIHYNRSATPRTVTVQITSSPAATSTTTLATSPPTASTNQPVTLTATVSAASGVPTGTVEFDSDGTAIPGCSARPLSASAPYTATCETSFAQAGVPALTDSFTSSTTAVYGSSSDPLNLFVDPGTTTTALTASSTTVTTGSSVTYTATVTPAYVGAATPTGSVTFTDGVAPISGCSTQPLTGSSSSEPATCTVSYATPGSHTVSASYDGDDNFASSTSAGTTVTALSPPTHTVAPATTLTPSPSLSGVSQSHRRWRLGGQLASFASAPKLPVGTTFRFTLNEPATVRFAFTQLLPGRKVNGKCVEQTARNRSHKACTRPVPKGSLSFDAGAGPHKLGFQGRLTRTSKLKPGTYTVAIAATNAAGQQATITLSPFTVAPG